MREEMIQPANSSEKSSAEGGKLAYRIVTLLSLTAILTSRYFPSMVFFTKY